jgi:hypothetical protein
MPCVVWLVVLIAFPFLQTHFSFFLNDHPFLSVSNTLLPTFTVGHTITSADGGENLFSFFQRRVCHLIRLDFCLGAMWGEGVRHFPRDLQCLLIVVYITNID